LPIKSTFTLNSTIIIDDYNATPNERLCITLPILTNCKISTDFSDLITAQITYDNEYILIDSINSAKIITDKIIDGRRILNILSDEIKFSNFNNSFSICGTVLVGGSHKTPIEIDSVKWQNPLIKTETSNGSLTINSCVINLRPIKLYNPTSINVTQINENQVKILTKSEITVLHEIYVYNLKNQLLDKYSYYRNPNSPFIEDKLLPINLYPNGSYYFLLKNSKEFKYFNLIILK